MIAIIYRAELKVKRILLVVCVTAYCATLRAEVDEYNVPLKVTACLNAVRDRDFEISDRMNPFYLRGDFDGNGVADYAVLIAQRNTGKAGIFVCFGRTHKAVRIAAGQPISLEGGKKFDDLGDFDAWNIDESGQPVNRKRDAIHLIAKEAGSGRFSWTGKAFQWTQLGI
jgi:hypothetical protein